MDAAIPQYLQRLIDNARAREERQDSDGHPDDRIGIALCTSTGHLYASGDTEAEFTIQSVSKPFIFALAVQRRGARKVLEAVELEPSGEAFDEISLGDHYRPMNPMINAGALAVNQLILGEDAEADDRVEIVRDLLSKLAGRDLKVNLDAAREEFRSADRNLALAHMLRSYGIINDSAESAVWDYTRQCCVSVTARDLAIMAATLANHGVNPITGERVLDARVCRLTMAVLSTTGMYDATGRWMARVGIPAKSGVDGGLIGMLPGQAGVATFSPGLDKHGNPIRGVRLFEALSDDMGLHLMNGRGRSAEDLSRAMYDENGNQLVQLYGAIDFTGAEAALHSLERRDADGGEIVLDLSEATEAQEMCCQMLTTGVDELRAAGYDIRISDPDGLLVKDGG